MGARRCRLLATFLTAALLAPLVSPDPALADSRGRWKHGHRGAGHQWQGHHHHGHYPPAYGYVAPGIYIGLPQVVIAPPPVVLTHPPVVVQAQPRLRCRSWTGTVVIGGQAQPAYGTQCLMPDGTWRLVD